MLKRFAARLLDRAKPPTVDQINVNLLALEQAVRGIVALPSATISSNQTLQMGAYDQVEWTLGASVTLTIDGTKAKPGSQMVLALTQDGTGSRLVTWSGVTWLSGVAPTLSTAVGARDVVLFISLDATTDVLGIRLGAPLEGTFQPGLSFGNGTTGLAYATRKGSWEKNGRTVIVRGHLTLSAKGASTGTARITGLPFTAWDSDDAYAGGLSPQANNMAALTSTIMCFINKNTDTIVLRHQGAAADAALNDTNFTDTSDLYFVVTYRAAS